MNKISSFSLKPSYILKPTYKKSLLLLALVCASPTQSQVLSLQQTYELALENDPQWSAIINQYEADQEIVAQGRSGLLPQVALSASAAHTDVDYDNAEDDSYTSEGYTASVSQPLFRLNTWHDYKRAKALNSQYGAEFQLSLEAFYLRVVTLYLDVLRANADLSYRQAEQEAISRQLEQSQQRFDVGMVAITDVQEARAAYDAAVSARISAEATVFVALRSLETIVGVEVDGVLSLSESLPSLPPEPADIQAWVDQALEHNSSLQSALYATEAAQENYKSSRAARAPTLDLVGAHSYSSSDAMNSGLVTPDSTVNQISLEFNLPIYAGGGLGANRRQSKYQHLAAQDNERLIRRQIVQSTTSFYQLVVASAAQVTASKQATVSAKVALDATQAGYEAGTRTIVDVLDAQRTLFQTQRDYANTRFDYVINSLNLQQVTGSLTETSLQELEKWMDPAAE